MIQFPHDIYLVDQRLFPLIVIRQSLFSKSFDCYFLFILHPLSQVDSSCVPLPYLTIGFVKIVEPPLIYEISELISPFVENLLVTMEDTELALARDPFELYSFGLSELLFVARGGLGAEEGELDVEVEADEIFIR